MHDLFFGEIQRICGLVETFGGTFELHYEHETPALKNDPAVTQVVRKVAERLLGSTSVLDIGPQLGADDFSYYTSRVPSCYFVLGVSRDDRATDLHSPNFDLNEDALPIGAAVLAESAITLSNLE
jgi:metal-dependent amidase/aminoacylase/carboxypeptidase family protein